MKHFVLGGGGRLKLVSLLNEFWEKTTKKNLLRNITIFMLFNLTSLQTKTTPTPSYKYSKWQICACHRCQLVHLCGISKKRRAQLLQTPSTISLLTCSLSSATTKNILTPFFISWFWISEQAAINQLLLLGGCPHVRDCLFIRDIR